MQQAKLQKLNYSYLWSNFFLQIVLLVLFQYKQNKLLTKLLGAV